MIPATAFGANSANSVNTSASDLSLPASYTSGSTHALPTTTQDMEFLGSTYTNTTFNLNSAQLTPGTLDDLDTTQSLTISNNGTGAGFITLSTAANGLSGTAGDLLWVKSGANLTVSSTSTSTPTLIIGATGNIDNAGTLNISSELGFSSTQTLTFTGAGTTTISGPIALATGGTTASSVVVNDLGGSVTFGGAEGYTGTTTIEGGGALALTGSINGATGGALVLGSSTLGGGTLSYGKTGTNTQTFTGTTLNAGASVVKNTVSTDTLNLGAITRTAVGSTVDFNPTGTGAITTKTANTGGILGGYATWAGMTTWAVSAGTGTTAGAISGLATASYNTSFAAGTNVDASGTNNLAAGTLTINSLRFNNGTAATTVNTGGALTVTTGGILETSAVGAHAVQINNNTITSSGPDLVVIQNNTASDLNIGSQVTGSIGLTKSGAGTLTLSNANNNYTGITTVNAGTINVTGTLAGGGAITMMVGGTGNLTESSTGTISGATAITQNDPSAVSTLAGTNTYTGATMIGAGSLSLLGTGTISGSAINIGTGTSVPGSGSFTEASTALITGSSSFVLNSTGTATLAAANSYTGGTTVTTGTLFVQNSAALGATGATIAGGLTSGAYDLQLANGTSSSLNLYNIVVNTSGTGTFIADQATAGAGSPTYTLGTVSIGGLGTNGGNFVVAQGANVTSGVGTINVGNVNITGASGIAILKVNSGVLNVTGNVTPTASTAGGVASGTFGVDTEGAAGGVGTVQGVISDFSSTFNTSVSDYQTAGNTWTFSGANTYSGGTVLTSSAGDLVFNNGSAGVTTASAIGTGLLTITGNDTFDTTVSGITLGTNNAQLWKGSFTFIGTQSLNMGTGAITVTATPVIAVNNNTLTEGGNISGAFGLTKTGAGTLALNGSSSSYTGTTTIENGTVSVGASTPSGAAGALGNATSAVVLGDATSLTSGLSTALLLNGAVTMGRNITVGTAGTNTHGNTYTIGGNAASTSTFAGTETLNQSLNVTQVAGGTTTFTGNITSGATGTQTVNFNNVGAVLQSAGTIGGGTGTIAVAQNGAGTTTLNSDNGYTGGTTISAGTLYANNTGGATYAPPVATGNTVTATNGTGSATGTGAVTVNSGGTLAGSGTVATANGITINAGGTLASGAIQSSAVAGAGLTINNTAVAITGAANSSHTTANTANLTFDLGSGASSLATVANPNTDTTYLSLAGSSSINFTGNTSITLVDLTNGGQDALRLNTPYLLVSAASDAAYTGLVVSNNGVLSLGGNGYVVGVYVSGTNSGNYVYDQITFNEFGADGVTGLAHATNSDPGYLTPSLYLNNGDLELVPEPGTWALMIGGLAILVVIQRRRNKGV